MRVRFRYRCPFSWCGRMCWTATGVKRHVGKCSREWAAAKERARRGEAS